MNVINFNLLFQIYRFTKSHWENESGKPLKSSYNLYKYDNEILRDLLQDPNSWGLPRNASFFSNFLLTYSDPKLGIRKERSISGNSTVEPEPRYGHAAASLEGTHILKLTLFIHI